MREDDAMPYRLSVRQLKKQYKKNLRVVARKIPNAFRDRKDRESWIREVTCLYMEELRDRRLS